MAAAAPAKLPLAIRKEVRDHEEKQAKLLADASAAVGSAVTYRYDMDAAYAHLEGSSYQPRIVPVAFNYLEQLIAAVNKAYKDDMVKQALDDAWTTHNIALKVLPTDKEFDEVKADKSTVGSSYFRLRLHEGELQVVTSQKWFNSNVTDIARVDLTPLASHASATSAAATPGAAEELPLEVRKRMRDVQPKVDESLAHIRQLKGLEDASFDVEATTRRCYPAMKHVTTQSIAFSPDAFPLYLDQLHALLAKQWKDDMVSEALLDEWKAPHSIELMPEVDIEKEQGAKIVKDGKYNALKLEGGKLLLLQGKGMWKTNLTHIANLDVVKIL